MSTKRLFRRFLPATPSFKHGPDTFLKGRQLSPTIKTLDRVNQMPGSRICLSLPVRPAPSCCLKARRITRQNRSLVGFIRWNFFCCHMSVSQYPAATLSLMKTKFWSVSDQTAINCYF